MLCNVQSYIEFSDFCVAEAINMKEARLVIYMKYVAINFE